MLEIASLPSKPKLELSDAELDALLTAQLAVAWAGERGGDDGEGRRLSWWRTDLVSEFGGHDLFKHLLPNTWDWAALQGAREAARRCDAELRSHAHDPDQIVSLFRLGFAIDERADERLAHHKRLGDAPNVALPALDSLISENWNQAAFDSWLTRRTNESLADKHSAQEGSTKFSVEPGGRLLSGPPPAELDVLAANLLAALSPLPGTYPLPHYRRKP